MFTRDFGKARQYLEKSISSSEKYAPENPNLYIKYSMKGSCFYEEKNFKEAVKLYEQSLQFLDKHPIGSAEQVLANVGLLNYQIGASYHEMKDFQKA